MIGGVVEEGTREGEVSGSNHTDRVARDLRWRRTDEKPVSLPYIKIFFFLFLKTDFIFSGTRFLQTVGITEPPVEIHFHGRFAVTRLCKPPNTDGSACTVLCVLVPLPSNGLLAARRTPPSLAAGSSGGGQARAEGERWWCSQHCRRRGTTKMVAVAAGQDEACPWYSSTTGIQEAVVLCWQRMITSPGLGSLNAWRAKTCWTGFLAKGVRDIVYLL